MNMNKALQNLYKAVTGEDNTKVNISKLLVDIHYAITGVQSPVKNNWSKIIDSMATNWAGGNPNVVQTITGTVDDLNIQSSFFELLSEGIFDNNVTAIMTITMGEQTGFAYLWGANDGTQLYGTASMIDTDGFLTMSVVWSLVDGNIRLGHFETIQGASGAYQVTDLKSMAAMCTTELTIIWHPLP